MNQEALDRFKKVYDVCYELYPDSSALPLNKLYYLHRQWIFPGHIDPVLEYVRAFHAKFYPKANLEVSLLAGLLHDTGLVVGRTQGSPEGHESRSCEYARTLLKNFGYANGVIELVVGAIEATEPSIKPKTEEAIIVRNADAYSHLSTVHFIAKAHFADNLPEYIKWFDAKIHSCFAKLTIDALVEEKKFVLKLYESQIELYSRHNHGG